MNKIIPLLIGICFLFFSGTLNAQRNPRVPGTPQPAQAPKFWTPDTPLLLDAPERGFMAIPGLTDEQKEQLKELRLKHMKEVQSIKNEMSELKAHLKTITSVDKPDMNAINKNIDEITSKINELMKSNAAHFQEIRKHLNEEQKLHLEMKRGPRGPGRGNFNCPCM